MQIETLPLTAIIADEEFNCRGPITLMSIQTLMDSIGSIGLKNPIAVQPYGDKYRILSGHRRFKALQFLGAHNAHCIVHRDLSEEDAALINLTENLEREDLNILEEAQGVSKLSGTAKSIAAKIKRTEEWVTIRLKLMKMPFQVRQAAASGWVLQSDLPEVLSLDGEPEEVILAKMNQVIERNREKYEQDPLTGRLKTLEASGRRKKRRRPTVNQINQILTTLLETEVVGLPAKVAAYTLGWISQEELLQEVRKLRGK